jgi:hypothetical protein
MSVEPAPLPDALRMRRSRERRRNSDSTMMTMYEAAAPGEFDPACVRSGVEPSRSGRGREDPEPALPRHPDVSTRTSAYHVRRDKAALFPRR